MSLPVPVLPTVRIIMLSCQPTRAMESQSLEYHSADGASLRYVINVIGLIVTVADMFCDR